MDWRAFLPAGRGNARPGWRAFFRRRGPPLRAFSSAPDRGKNSTPYPAGEGPCTGFHWRAYGRNGGVGRELRFVGSSLSSFGTEDYDDLNLYEINLVIPIWEKGMIDVIVVSKS